MVHMKLLESEFYKIINRDKVMEVRLNDEKRKKLKKSDIIFFHNISDFSEVVKVNVLNKYEFNTFKELYDSFPVKCFGANNYQKEDLLENIYNIYSTKDESLYGVLAIEFEIIDEER